MVVPFGVIAIARGLRPVLIGGRAVLVAVWIGVTVSSPVCLPAAVTYAMAWWARVAREVIPRVWAAPEAAGGPAMTAAAATAAASGASNTGQRSPGRPMRPISFLFTRPFLPGWFLGRRACADPA